MRYILSLHANSQHSLPSFQHPHQIVLLSNNEVSNESHQASCPTNRPLIDKYHYDGEDLEII